MESNEIKRKGMVQSVERAIMILRCFEDNSELGITDISKILSLHKSTTFGLINTLNYCGLLKHDEKTGKYRIGIELFRLGSNFDYDIRNIVSPYISDLMFRCKETVNFVIRDGDYILYLDKNESPHSMRICTKVGQRLPLYCTAAGKGILANLDLEETHEILSRTKFIPYTSKTMLTVEDVLLQLEEVKVKGYAVDNEELEYGLVCIAVPILNRVGAPIGGISVSGPITRMNSMVRNRLAELLKKYAAQIARDIR